MRINQYILFFLISLLAQNRLVAQISPGPLAQSHAHLEGISNCTKCHSIGNAVTDKKCLACHKEIQSLITQKRGYHASTAVKGKTCVDCHNDHHGRKFEMTRFDQKKFDHNLTGYKLEGAHGKIECKDCHKPANIANTVLKKRSETFIGLQTACLNCHTDYHQTTLGKNCASCHNIEKFKPAPQFNHNKAKFQLKGAHANQDCIECHKKTTKNGADYQEFKGIKFAKCTDCHKDVHDGKFGSNCLKCHNELSFKQLTITNSFNHNLTDYPLTGQHVGIDCKKCHKGNNYSAAINTTHCNNCHVDYHKGDFAKNGNSPDCNECHTLDNPFTSTSYTIDNHQKSQYPLVGAHMATACTDCHKKTDRWTFKIQSSQCIDCHKDIHKGKIDEKYYPKSNCLSCHNSDSWTGVKFDHTKTPWELKGKHATVSCRECHFSKEKGPDNLYLQKFNSIKQTCTQCHDNIHGDQFAVNNVTDCKKCHSESKSWNIENFDHSKTQFQLDGKHKDVECKACHKQTEFVNGKERRVYKIAKFQCIDCHS